MVVRGVCKHKYGLDVMLWHDRGRVLPPLIMALMEGDFGVTNPSTEELSMAMATSVADERDGETIMQSSVSVYDSESKSHRQKKKVRKNLESDELEGKGKSEKRYI